MEADEEVLKTVRKHWFILFADIAGPIILFFIPIVVFLFARNVDAIANILTRFAHPDAYALFFISFWGLVVWMLLFYLWTDYYLDLWIITDRRIIAVNQIGLFRRTTASFRFERLQDVHIEVHGIIATFLGFGNVRTQTAGQEVDFKITGIPNPHDIKALILHSADNLLTKRQGALRNAMTSGVD